MDKIRIAKKLTRLARTLTAGGTPHMKVVPTGPKEVEVRFTLKSKGYDPRELYADGKTLLRFVISISKRIEKTGVKMDKWTIEDINTDFQTGYVMFWFTIVFTEEYDLRRSKWAGKWEEFVAFLKSMEQ
jgi:hypothetical protein